MLNGLLPIAHAGHYVWVLYLVPIAIVLVSIVNSLVRERRLRRGAGSDSGDPGDHEDREEADERRGDARP